MKFVVLCHASALTASSNLTLTLPPSGQTNVTWIRVRTLDPRDSPRQCVNCTTPAYEDPTIRLEYQQRKRRKRRRNRKPPPTNSRNERRDSPSKDRHQHKKHSTRVRLDRPVQFLVAPDAPPQPEVSTQQSSTSTQATTKQPPPVRYLLPPFFDRYLDANEIFVDRKIATKSETSPSSRGSTKFKNTIYYKDYKENEIDTDEVYFTASTAGRPEVKLGRTEFKPIVVQPVTPSYSVAVHNTTSQPYLSDRFNDRSRFVSDEVANAGMQVITMRTTLVTVPTTERERISPFGTPCYPCFQSRQYL
jgi:hypothetical protein